MHHKIIEAIAERYQGGDCSAVTRAKKAGTFELILIALSVRDILDEILKKLSGKKEDSNV